MSNYYVLAFTSDNKDSTYSQLIRAGKASLKESIARFKKNPLLLLKAHKVELYTYNPKKAEHKLPEYAEYAYVCFLNEGAMSMYRDCGVSLKVEKIIPESKLPRGLQLKRSLYLPK